jgi:hypothetical protein
MYHAARYNPQVMRRPFRLLFALSSAVAVLLAVSTFRRTSFLGTVTEDGTPYGAGRTTCTGLFSGFGRIGIGAIDNGGSRGYPPSLHTRTFRGQILGDWGPWRYQGTDDPCGLFIPFFYDQSESHGDAGAAHYTAVTLPYWMIVALLLLPAVAPSALRHATRWLPRRKPLPGRCAACGYDLRATPDRCPECGKVPATNAL